MTDLLLDVNIVIDICAPRPAFEPTATAAVQLCKFRGYRIWLYAGSVQTFVYTLQRALRKSYTERGQELSKTRGLKLAQRKLAEFVRDKHWLAALAGEGDVFGSADPEDEQLIRSLDRFQEGKIKLLTRDRDLLKRCSQALTPEQYLELDHELKSMDFIDLKSQQDTIRPELERGIHRVLHHGQYIMGPEIKQLEAELATYVGIEHAITCASGTDALLMALMALEIGPGDEVITVPYTWISTAEVISLLRAKPVFVDIQPDTFNMDPNKIAAAITKNTRAIMPVGIYGQCADMTRINAIAAGTASR